MSNIRHAFDSYEAFVEDVQQVPKVKGISSRDVGRDSHFGTHTFEQAVELAHVGWPEGAARVAEIRASLDKYVEASKVAACQQFAWDVVGDFVDVGRVLFGEPEACGSYNEYETGRFGSQRVVRLYANLGVSAGVKAEAIFARGAVVLAAVDVLESLGLRVELWAGKATSRVSGGEAQHQVEVLVKAASQPVDVDRLAFALCHNASLRRLCWSHQERFGFLPNHCYPAALVVDEGCVATSEARRDGSHTQEELAAEVAKLCEQCGVVIPSLESC
jgi:hypothetical protein